MTLPPIPPRVKDAQAYERKLREVVLLPFFKRIWARVNQVGLSNISAIRTALLAFGAPDSALDDPVREVAAAQALALQAYQLEKWGRQLNRLWGVDAARLINEATVRPLVRGFIAENVDLIKTIPPRFHASIVDGLDQLARVAPFDQSQVRAMFRDKYRSAGYNLRRLSRDQTSKLIGNLAEIRNLDAGFHAYVWRTAGDERVRPSHRDLDGTQFFWSAPPAVGHPGHDIQCRCVAEPVVPELSRVSR